MAECGRSCKHWPPSSMDGKPCSICDTSSPLLNCYERKIKRGRPKNPDSMHSQFRIRLNKTQREQLKTLAAKNGKTESAMLRDLIKEAFLRS